MHRCVFRTFLKAVHMSAICTGIKEKVKVTPKYWQTRDQARLNPDLAALFISDLTMSSERGLDYSCR
jgi:hypothetical protein